MFVVSEAELIPVDRENAHVPQPWNPKLISPSRVNSFLQCGVAFKLHYVDGIPEARSGSAALFGNVMHTGLEHWHLDHSQDLVTLTAAAWFENTKAHRATQNFIKAYQHLSVQAMKKEKEIRDDWASRGKESKAPRMTADWKKSDVAIAINRLLAEHLPKLADAPWQFSERDPLPALYDESLIVAAKYQRKYQGTPAALHTEFGFKFERNGNILRGYIDAIDPILDDDGVLVGYGVEDYKTYRQLNTAMKDWRQGVIYDLAVADLIKRGVLDLDPDLPRYVIFNYVRLLIKKDYVYGEKDYAKLDEELALYTKAIDNDIFLPAEKNSNPDFCGYPEQCCLNFRGEGVGCRGGLYQDEA